MKIHKAIHKKIPQELMRVTPLSKTIAAIVFIALPFVGFLFGIEYGKFIAQTDLTPIESTRLPLNPTGVMCTMDAKICPDGTAVGRSGPMCEFTACPLPGIDLTDDTSTQRGETPAMGY
ncbi:MAG: hypothetical protein M3Q44_05510 [bacterium]|nr:hypothetical protein [bacterium]